MSEQVRPVTLQRQSQQLHSALDSWHDRPTTLDGTSANVGHSSIPDIHVDETFWAGTGDTTDVPMEFIPFESLVEDLPLMADVRINHADESIAEHALPEPLSLPGDLEDLLRHYREIICPAMMPTINPSQNPWLQVYLPLALQTPRSAATSALLHAILAVAIQHKAKIEGQVSSSVSVHSAKHRAYTLSLLQGILSERHCPDDHADRHAMLAASMSLITIDVFSGNKESCNTYLKLARTVLHGTGGETWWKSSLKSSILYQTFKCYEMVASTARSHAAAPNSPESTRSWSSDSPGTSPGGEKMQFTARENHENDRGGFNYMSHYTLDTSFGISLHTMALLDKTIRLVDKTVSSPGACSPSGQHFHLADEVEHDLYSVLSNPELLSAPIVQHKIQCFDDTPWKSSTTLPTVIADELTENHMWAFHYGVILFYHRAVRLPTRKDHFSENMQLLVSKLFDHLENIDCLTSDTDVRPANTLWPGFVAACEAINTDLRHRALIWFARAAKHKIGNISQAKDLVMDIWRRVDRQNFSNSGHNASAAGTAGLGPVDWRVVMEESGFGTMLT
ncbi:hypothetical protein AUEXF2481DRAFT_252438 [Aureobasidium subglaciale EXF-2481]|uniref:Transcription factor domain-containing protein n=1 Tax=Aureobasidium subglaciale (strain EXF-2481) TaxID=1043005 RepID=A0A074YF68_AURSE|nr:uncharacterized protein AUEXF2481DRAFT_252438 [Aureobasidium subglaciale EXF-2481]KEQ94674.1 hypothetical protein AUEXF2481DRAFT_252438 [Aureobasidium subglaciale EXF-2481]